MKNKNIVVIFVLMLLVSIFVTPVSAQSPVPIELELTVESSTIKVGNTSTVTVRILDENGKPVVTEADIHVTLSADRGSVYFPIVIPAGTNLSSTQFTPNVTGVSVISAKSKGLISDTASIAVVYGTEAMPRRANAPGFEAIFAIAGLFAVTYLLRRSR